MLLSSKSMLNRVTSVTPTVARMFSTLNKQRIHVNPPYQSGVSSSYYYADIFSKKSEARMPQTEHTVNVESDHNIMQTIELVAEVQRVQNPDLYEWTHKKKSRNEDEKYHRPKGSRLTAKYRTL